MKTTLKGILEILHVRDVEQKTSTKEVMEQFSNLKRDVAALSKVGANNGRILKDIFQMLGKAEVERARDRQDFEAHVSDDTRHGRLGARHG